MIVRYVFLKLKPEFADASALAETRARSRLLASITGVRSLVIGTPADEGARSAWDLSLALHFDSLSDVERYLGDAAQIAYCERFLEPRLQIIKAWNFELEPS